MHLTAVAEVVGDDVVWVKAVITWAKGPSALPAVQNINKHGLSNICASAPFADKLLCVILRGSKCKGI